jgi:DNA-binding PadR family transcriptional regulator
MEALEEQSSGALSIEGGTLYPILHRLESTHLVSGKWSVQSGRKRRTYALTAKGKAALASERSDWKEFVRTLGGIMSPAGGATA